MRKDHSDAYQADKSYKQVVTELEQAQANDDDVAIWECLERLHTLEQEESRHYRGTLEKGVAIVQVLLGKNGSIETRAEYELISSLPLLVRLRVKKSIQELIDCIQTSE